MLKRDLGGVLRDSRSSNVILRWIKAAGLLDGALEEASESVPDEREGLARTIGESCVATRLLSLGINADARCGYYELTIQASF
jgi:hypothetical protein